MKSHEILKNLISMRKLWNTQSFSFSAEQRAEYDRLLALRRERVKYMYDNNMVWKGPNKKTVETSK